jgi:hypothetical protein
LVIPWQEVALTNSQTDHLDIEKELNQELAKGPVNITLSDLKFPEQIQDGLNALNAAIDATFILYCIGIAAAGLAILAAFVAFFLHGSRLVSLGNWGLSLISFLSLLIASIIITIVQNKATGVINKYGNDIGLFAYKGQKYLIFTWVSVAAMFVALIAWTGEFCVGRRNSKREYTEKTAHHRGGFRGWKQRRSDEHALRRSGV